MIEKILERLRKRRDFHYKKNKSTFLNYRMETFEEAIKIVQEVAKEHGNGWIPCSERLPQESEPADTLCEIVNITLKNGTVTVGWCNRYLEKWYVLDEHCDYPVPREYEDVLAWQPLPPKCEPKNAPYQKGDN